MGFTKMKLTAIVVCLWCLTVVEASCGSCDSTTVTTTTTSNCDNRGTRTATTASTSSEDDLEAQLISMKSRLDAYDNIVRENRITFCGSGIKDYRVKDSQITASSKHPNPDSAWTAHLTDLNQWLQVDYEDEKTFYGVVLQGRPKHNQWTNSYQVQYKLVEADDFKFVSDASGTV